MPRFFALPENIDRENKKALLLGDDARHIARSLRMAVGDILTLCDGEGAEYSARLTRIRDEECELDLECEMPANTEPPHEITLFMAYPKADKLETVVQKAVELGCTSIIPFISERCVKRPSDEKKDRQTSRLTRIAHEAAKQCGRGKLPTVSAPVDFNGLLSKIQDYDLALFCFEGEGTKPLKDVLTKEGRKNKIAVIIGSEGGFSNIEAEKITAKGAIATGLGKRILRCETAPTVCLSMILYELEM